MSITFESIPSDIRVPLCYIEINNTGANSGLPTALNKVLIIGQRTTDGTAVAGQLNNVFSAQGAQALYGRSSMLASMIGHFKDLNKDADVWAIALDDAAAGAAAIGNLAIIGTATANGTLSAMIGGIRIRVGVVTGDTGAIISTALIAAINANLDAPVTAAAYVAQLPPAVPGDDPVVPTITLTARHKGICGNDIDLRFNYYGGEVFPVGVTASAVAMSGGTANPDIDVAIAAMGATWFNYLINPYTDQANLDALSAELLRRWGPTTMIDGIAFSAMRGTLAQTTTFGTARNDYLFCTMGTGLAPNPPYVWASRSAAVTIASLLIDPARPLQTLAVPGLLAPAESDEWLWEDRNTLLHDGVSTFTVNSRTVQLERMVTMYQRDGYGNADTSYLNVNTPATLSYIRYATRVDIEQKFPRCKLADNGTPISYGQAIVTPKIVKDELISLGYQLNERGLIENMEAFKKSLLVERDLDDRNRLNVSSSPDIVNQFNIYAQAINFKV